MTIAQWIALTFLSYWVLVTVFYLALMVTALPEIRKQYKAQKRHTFGRLVGSNHVPTVTVILPAYNEADILGTSIRAALALDYPALQLLVVNDGSKDHTIALLEREFQLRPVGVIHDAHLARSPVKQVYRSSYDPRITVIDKENGGKADAVNAGIDLIDTDLFLALDADTLVEHSALQRMVRPFLTEDHIVGVGGIVKAANGCRIVDNHIVEERTPTRPLEGLQMLEYLRDFMLGRLGLNKLGGNLIVSGAFGLFQRDVVVEMGGYDPDSVGEDMELATRIVRERRHLDAPPIGFLYDAVSYTEVPSDLKTLRGQRERWHLGLLQILRKHRGLMFSWRDRGAGLVVFPSYLLVGALSPVMEASAAVAGIWTFVTDRPQDWLFTWSILALAMAIGVSLNLVSTVLDEVLFARPRRTRDRALMMLWGLAEPIGYRQLTSYFRWRGMIRFFLGRTAWGETKRAAILRSDMEGRSPKG